MAKNNKLKTSFNMYEKNRSRLGGTLFDLFPQSGEVPQTKALAYTLSAESEFLLDFLKIIIPERKKEWRQATRIEVIAELLSNSDNRADIVIKVWDENQPLRAVIIEAKGAGVTANVAKAEEQLSRYLEEEIFPGLSEFDKSIEGVLLTKSKIFSKMRSVTWSEIVELLEGKLMPLLGELKNYLMEVNKGMKYYDVEVRSITAKNTIKLIEKHNVYTRSTEAKKIGRPLFVTFRAQGGSMEHLYKVEDEIILNSESDLDVLAASEYQYKKQLTDYIKEHREGEPEILAVPHVFLILSKKRIPLEHKPKPRKTQGLGGDVIYTLDEILTKNELTPAPRK